MIQNPEGWLDLERDWGKVSDKHQVRGIKPRRSTELGIFIHERNPAEKKILGYIWHQYTSKYIELAIWTSKNSVCVEECHPNIDAWLCLQQGILWERTTKFNGYGKSTELWNQCLPRGVTSVVLGKLEGVEVQSWLVTWGQGTSHPRALVFWNERSVFLDRKPSSWAYLCLGSAFPWKQDFHSLSAGAWPSGKKNMELHLHFPESGRHGQCCLSSTCPSILAAVLG